MVRTLKAEGYQVERTQNITDVGHLVSDDDSGEDKMEKGARAEGVTAWDVAKKYSEIAEHEAYDALNLIRPDHLVAATSCIDKQIEFAQVLDEKGYLYRTEDGMYFDTSKLSDYGKLAKLDIAGLEAGARVEMAGKKNPTDFAVWKFSPKDQQRDMEWESPWGTGFPGWHLECSVIARETLGDQIDIHTGGIDHIPVHHTNEIAQTESVTDKPFSTFWVHNNHIKVDGTKISKSLGNIYTLDDITSRSFSIDAYKIMAYSKHYRTEGNFTWEILEAAQNRLNHWRELAAIRWQIDDSFDQTYPGSKAMALEHIAKLRDEIIAALADDLDTPSALIRIDTAVSSILAQPTERLHRSVMQKLFENIDELLGLRILESTPDITNEQKELITKRQEARQQKNWAMSDELRDQLTKHGIGLRDATADTYWYYL
jgi:cysteinyl-tRNA synthetase